MLFEIGKLIGLKILGAVISSYFRSLPDLVIWFSCLQCQNARFKLLVLTLTSNSESKPRDGAYSLVCTCKHYSFWENLRLFANTGVDFKHFPSNGACMYFVLSYKLNKSYKNLFSSSCACLGSTQQTTCVTYRQTISYMTFWPLGTSIRTFSLKTQYR